MKKRFWLWGRAVDTIRANCIQAIRDIDQDQDWIVTIERKKKQRTSKQNAALYGVKYPVLMEFMGLRGKDDEKELHEFMCGEYFGWREVEFLGRKMVRPVRTTTTNEDGKRDVLTGKAFWDFVEFVDQKAAENGCALPDPDPWHASETKRS